MKIDLALVTRHPFSIVNLHNFLFGACVWGCFSFVPYYAVMQYGMSPLESGAIMTPRSVTAILLGTITSFLMFRLGYRAPIVVGLALISVSNIILGFADLLCLIRAWVKKAKKRKKKNGSTI